MSKFIAAFAFLVTLFIMDGSGFSLPSRTGGLVTRTMGKMMNCEFDSAFFLCDSLSAADPADPAADMLRLSALGFYDLDCNHVSDSIRFYTQVSKTESAVYSYEASKGTSSYSLTVKGFSRAISACYFLWHRSYLKGLNTGFDALSVLEAAKKEDVTNADVDLFLGLYNYARADMKRMFWWAFFWYPGDKETGVRRLAVCRKRGEFANPVATLVLAELMIREKKYQEAEGYLAELSRDFPGSRLTRWTQAKFNEEQKLYAKAAEIYRGLADEYDTVHAAWRNAFAARLKEAAMFDKAGAGAQAAEACRKIIAGKKDHNDSVTKQIMKDAQKILEENKSRN
jgi:hypothetical protein